MITCSLAACSLLTDLGSLGQPTDGGADSSQEAGDAAAKKKRIFFTRGAYLGPDIGGVAGADAKCAAIATTRNLGGTFKAWLSDSKTDAHDRIVDVSPWYSVDRATLLFPTKASLDYLPSNPITLDETSTTPDAQAFYWTGTVLGGTKSQEACNDWTTSADGGLAYGTAGLVGALDQGWTNTNGEWCGLTCSLLCIEQ